MAMESDKNEKTNEKKSPPESVTSKDSTGLDEAACRCKEAQGKGIADFVKIMLDDLAFWRKKP
jgi:hypothetical protein